MSEKEIDQIILAMKILLGNKSVQSKELWRKNLKIVEYVKKHKLWEKIE